MYSALLPQDCYLMVLSLHIPVSYTHLDVYKRQMLEYLLVMLSVKGEEYTYSYIKKEVLKGHIPYEKDKKMCIRDRA